MNSSAYYVRKGLKFSTHYYLKHFYMIFVSLVVEIARFLSYFLFFLAPAFSKMQFNFNKMLTETGDANYAKSFDDADKSGAYLTRVLYFGVTTLITLVLISIIPLIVFGIQEATISIIEKFNKDIVFTVINDVFTKIYIFAFIISGLIGLLSLIFIQVGNYICCASNNLSLGDVFYNTILTMKKNGGKIILTCSLYILMILSFLFVFGFPVLLVYNLTITTRPEVFSTVLTVILVIVGIILFFILPVFLNGMRLSLHLMLEKCAELDRRMVIVNRKDINGNTIKINVLPYDEKTKVIESDLNELNNRRK